MRGSCNFTILMAFSLIYTLSRMLPKGDVCNEHYTHTPTTHKQPLGPHQNGFLHSRFIGSADSIGICNKMQCTLLPPIPWDKRWILDIYALMHASITFYKMLARIVLGNSVYPRGIGECGV